MHNTSKEIFNTSESKIQAEFNHVSIQEQETRKGILILGSNPYWPNSENNKILNEMFYKLASKEFCVMKILFHPYESNLYKKNDYKDIKYVRDTSVAIDYFFSKFSCVKYFVIVGYSWCSSIALNILMRRPEISSFVLISPTLALKNYDSTSFLSIFKTRGLILHGGQDQITSINTVLNYIKLLQSKKIQVQHHIIQNADHYYTEGMEEMLEHFCSFMKGNYKPNDNIHPIPSVHTALPNTNSNNKNDDSLKNNNVGEN